MAFRSRINELMVLTLIFFMALWEGGRVVAQSSSCTNVIISMSPCLDYVTGNSSSPSSSCCSQFANVVSSQPQCLCEVLNGGASSLGVTINQTQALALPSACNVQTPPVSRCNGSSAPAASPSPSTDVGSSDANTNKLAFSLLFFLLFVASYASTSTANF